MGDALRSWIDANGDAQEISRPGSTKHGAKCESFGQQLNLSQLDFEPGQDVSFGQNVPVQLTMKDVQVVEEADNAPASADAEALKQ